MSQCSSCGAEVIWAKTIKGRTMPLDAEPVENGNVVIDDEGRAHIHRNASSIAARLRFRPRYISHFATCPNAKEHRKR